MPLKTRLGCANIALIKLNPFETAGDALAQLGGNGRRGIEERGALGILEGMTQLSLQAL
ncbi:MAG: hypothetical protein AAF699_13360 [Pseudomonadota bacterium]